MAQWSTHQTTFNAGEFSPRAYGRTDLDQHEAACRTALNFLPLVQGPITRRPGTRFVAKVKDSSKTTRVVRFIFSTEQAYILEFGDLYMRVFRNEVAVGAPFELVTPYVEADIMALQFTQSADVLFVTHPDYPPAKISRTAHDAWTHADVVFIDGPYENANDDFNKKMNPSALTGAITVTATGHSPFLANRDEGRFIRIGTNTGAVAPPVPFGYVVIDSVASSTVANCTVVGDLPGLTAATENWSLGALYGDRTNPTPNANYPATSTFHQGRWVLGGVPETPDTIYASMTFLFESFSPQGDGVNFPTEATGGAALPVASDNSYRFTLGATEVNTIQWMKTMRGLAVGTTSSIFEVAATVNGEALTPTNVNVLENFGSSSKAIDPVRKEDALIYVDRSGNHIHGLSPSGGSAGFADENLMLLSDHIARGSISDLAYAEDPQGWICAVCGDGTLAIGMSVPDQRVVGWCPQTLGGSFSGSNAVVESVASIPGPNADHDQFWFVVKRTINGATVRTIEFMDEPFRIVDRDQAIEDAYFVDCGLTLTNGSPTTAWSGLDHLEGETVHILADGSVDTPQVVTAGAITTTRAVSKVQVGLPYNSDFESLRADAQLRVGSIQGLRKRVARAILRVHETVGGSFGPDSGKLDVIPERSDTDPMDEPPPLFSGDHYLSVEPTYDREGKVFYRQSNPLPAMILALTLLGDSGDG